MGERGATGIRMQQKGKHFSDGKLHMKLKLQYFGYLMRRAHSLEKTLILGKIEGKGGRGKQRMRRLDSITNSTKHEFEQTLGDSGGRESLLCCSPWGCRESDTSGDWTLMSSSIFLVLAILMSLWRAIYNVQIISSILWVLFTFLKVAFLWSKKFSILTKSILYFYFVTCTFGVIF